GRAAGSDGGAAAAWGRLLRHRRGALLLLLRAVHLDDPLVAQGRARDRDLPADAVPGAAALRELSLRLEQSALPALLRELDDRDRPVDAGADHDRDAGRL